MNNIVGTIFRYQLQFLPFVCLIKKERKKEHRILGLIAHGRLFDRIINKDAIVATPLRIDVSIQE